MGCDVGLHDGEAPGEGRDEETMDDEASTPPCRVVCERRVAGVWHLIKKDF
jgi:hypothetical protein